jgi:hypothetical protein
MGSFFAGVTPARAAPDLEVYGMTTEYMKDPIGLGRQDLVFSWKLRKGDERGVRQATYQILVSDGDEMLWDSGVVTSDCASGVLYGGGALAAGQAYHWRVTVTDNRGASASDEATFGMGLFTEADWNGAQWISSTGGTSTGGGADPERYTVEADFTLETGSFGLMLGADTNNFFLYQLNAVHDNTYIYVRPHRWAGGGAALLGENNTGIPIEDFLGREHNLRLEIDHGRLTGYLDGSLVTYDGQEALTHDAIRELAGVGVRAYYNPNNTDKDAVKINKLVLRDSLGRLAYYDDFTGANSLDRGTVEDGQLVICPTGTESVEWRAWQRPADSQIYSAQADVQIGACAAGFVLGAQDSSHFYMWQLNTFDYPAWSAPAAEKLTYLRPHLWNGGPSEYGQDVNVNDVVSKAEVESAPVTLRVDVNNGTLTTYLNGVRVDQRTSAQHYGIGAVGARQAKDTNSPVPETGYFDNILLRDTGGRVVSSDDFEDGVNHYEGAGASLEGGRLKASGGSGREVFLRADTTPAPQGASRVPLLRKDFTTKDKEIARAVVYASALGHYELQLNGDKVGEDYMAPGWTEYDTRVQYQAYDVTAQVTKNAVSSLGAMLAPGWYAGNISILGNRIYGSTQALIANLVIEYADGEKQTVVTDGTWTYSLDGPILETDMFDGESYDAARELGGGKYGWAVPSFDNSAWGTAGVLFDRAFGVKTDASGDNTIALTAQIGPTVRQIRTLTPVSIRQVGGKYIVDMGQNFAGILEMSLTGHTGQTATIRYGEMLNDGPQGQRGNDNPDGAGSLYTSNLRSAKATDRYTFKSDQKETWTPTFTFHGFRYAEISGVSEAPALSDIRGLALASAMDETGAFDSSSALLNQIYQNAFWGQRSNFLSVPTDCPQRDERMGWGADTHVFAGTGLYNMDASMFYQKWLQDVRDGQAAGGGYGDVAPNPHNFMNDIVWNAGGVILPHTIWRMTGDTRVLTDSYDSMRRYMAYRMGMGDIQSCGYGDWLEPVDGSSDKNVVGTAYFAYQLSLMADIAEALGRSADADAYRARFAQVNSAFHTQFAAADGTISNGIQSGYVLALGVGLTTPETEPLFVNKLVDRIAADGGLMSVGFVSVNKLMPVLTRYGHSDIAYQLALTTQYPSWGYSIAQGATTVWERWNSYTVANGFGPVSMNSFNHYSFGSVAEWFYSGIAGIGADPEAPGFQNVIIAPTLDGRLTYANARYESIRGEIFSGWAHEAGETYALEVRVPANATATVVLPVAPDTVWEGGLRVLDENGAAQGEGISAVAGRVDETRISVGSGRYRFTFDWAAPATRAALQAAVTAAEKTAEMEEDYTAESLTALQRALAAAKEVLAAPTATQGEVDAAAEALQAAVAALEKSGYVNLAYQRPVTASSQVSAGGIFSSDKLTDGARRGGGETTWSSNNTLNANHTEWVTIDLGAAVTFNRFVIFPRDDDTRPETGGHGFPNAFSLEVSQDGVQWTSVGDYTQYPFTGTQAQRFRLPEQTARYVRMTGTGLNLVEGLYRMQLAEFEIYHIEETVEAQWIWDRATDDRNTWTAFRKRFTLAAAPAGPVDAQIAVDAKYWLYVNGELAVFEGGLKRGPNWNDTYVDHVDIAPYLRAGENTIAVLAWHFGQGDWYSATNSGQAGLYFSVTGGGVRVASDESWKARRVEAYGFASQQPNYRIPESSLLFDARKGLTNWQATDYDDGAWAQAMTFGSAGTAPWNRLEDRPIPLFAYGDYVAFEETELTKTVAQAGSALREIPADDYVIEAQFRIVSAAFGVIFGYQDTNNLNMWQIFGTSAGDVNNGVPWLKPHIKSNGVWSVAGKFNIDSVPHDEMFTHEYTLRLVVENKEVKGYVDGNLVYTGQALNTRGGFGFRADPGGEQGSVGSLKVTSLDGAEVYYEDHFDGENNFNRGVIEDGRFVWRGTGSDEAIAVIKQLTATYTAKLPTNFQFTPYIRLNAPKEGAMIRMYTDKLNVGCVMAEYITKAGPQTYESLGWMNGDQLIFEVPADVEVEALGYRRSGYAATFDGSFTSDDEFLNILWRKARDTLYVTMRDGFMDCPDRERAQWWGDAVNEMQMAFYSLSPDAALLVKKGIGNVLGYVRDGVIPTVAPINTSWFELPAQSMAGIMSFYLYYEYTGDDSHFARAYPAAHTYLLTKFNMGADGVVQHRGGSWDWSDWGSYSDQKLITNAWYYVALDRTLKMAERLGADMETDATVQALQARKRSIEEHFDAVFWNDGGFYRTPGVGTTDDRGNALAVYAGLASADRYPALRNVLMTTRHASPYMEKYVLEALYLMGYEDSALERMKSRYAEMVASHYSTLWEFWDPNSGTQNHAWTGGPLTMLSGYAAGVRPLTPGYETFTVAPQLGGIRNLSVVVPTVRGEIAVSADAAPDGTARVHTTVPAGTTAVVGVPLTGGRRATTVYCGDETIWENGQDMPNEAGLTSTGSDDKFVYFTVTSDITLTAARGAVQMLTVSVDDGQNMRLFVDGVEQAAPYQAMYLKGERVRIQFVSRYAGEYGVVAVDGADLGDETQMDYMVQMEKDYTLLAHAEWIGPVNLARGKIPVEADNAMVGAADGAWGSNNLVDGERVGRAGKSGFTTREYFSQRDISANPHKVTIDLGAVKNVDRVYIYPRSDAATAQGGYPNYPQDFTIQVSTDGVSYTAVKTVTGEPAPTAAQGRGEYVFDVVPARYVRIVTTMLGLPAADEGTDAQGRVRNRLQLAEIEVYGQSDFTFDVAVDKAARTVTVIGSGFEPGERALLRTGYNYAPAAQANDYRLYVTADGAGRVDLTLPASVTADLPWLGGHRYYVSLGGVTKSAPIPATEVRAHSSARISLRIKGKAPLNLNVEALPEEAYAVTSSNAAVVAVDRVDGAWVVTGKKAGTVLVTVRVSEEYGAAVHVVTVSVG